MMSQALDDRLPQPENKLPQPVNDLKYTPWNAFQDEFQDEDVLEDDKGEAKREREDGFVGLNFL